MLIAVLAAALSACRRSPLALGRVSQTPGNTRRVAPEHVCGQAARLLARPHRSALQAGAEAQKQAATSGQLRAVSSRRVVERL